ncbi:beta-mannosidase [Deinococcus peraridilitoris]|uniref:Beta-mannosidase n=1 Tax=Deinococcus peraridilitoris (strain DSM 19664 / LMG 22246 / CIP 109416 / KR-200) TaxID=937777 RepID=K9ZY36_DEIPD|nr:glycoside hydrolase family 2 protein [Deinococcus peraridilitoris]AFZ65645.1 beta-galactosidase/beta-glucuronidase [Deinococcus peraridilitoris DSM 19664]
MPHHDPARVNRSAPSPYRQDLGGAWQLTSSVSEAWRFRRLHAELQQEIGAFARTSWIEARVPGSVHDDLIRAGLVRDPNEGLASLSAEWVSERQWVYRRTFRVSVPPCARLRLCFDGADHGGEVYLNGEHLGPLGGTHTPVRFDVSSLERNETHLLVVVLPEAPREAGQLGRTSLTSTLKARYGYWWDFATRLVHVGLWRDVSLEGDAGSALTDVFAWAELDAGYRHAVVHIELESDSDSSAPMTVELHHPDGRSEVTRTLKRAVQFELTHPQLWWPAGLGAQPLYTLRASLPGSAGVARRFGVRHIRLVHNPASRARGARPYTLQVNGRALYARGFNVVPTDLIPGRAHTTLRERALISYAAGAHANLLRFNGVGPVAPRSVLDACDEAGLLIWQDMPLTSSGTDNVPPRNPAFLAALERDLPPLIRTLRNHPCVALYTAGNELTDQNRSPASEADPTIARIRELIGTLDPTRPFLPTSPSGPQYDLREDVALTHPEELHDVHGPWHYRGVLDSFRPHTLNRALAHSEFGCQAASREATLQRYLTDGPVWPMDDRNPQVVHHGEWWLMRHRIEEVFGRVDDLGRYVRLTQAAQADVLRHALLWNRARRGECSLALVWQLNEPWPNAHNTSVIDYDLKPKLAYYRCREANAPLTIHLGLSAPVARGHFALRPQILADQDGEGQLSVTLFSLDGTGSQRECRRVRWGQGAYDLNVRVPGEPALLRAELRSLDGSLLARSEQWIAPDQNTPFAALLHLPPVTLHAEQDGSCLLIRNAGAHVAPWVTLEAPADVSETFGDNGFSLLPGETRAVDVSLTTLRGAAVSSELTVSALNATRSACSWEAP